VVSTELGAPDANGRRNLWSLKAPMLPADAVVMAFGFQPNPSPDGW
jgi:glutamate synthase (NADPH/NADH) small chain